MKKVLVTGGAGFIGSHTVEAFLEAGYNVTVVDNLSTGKFENIASLDVEFFHCDIRDRIGLERVFEASQIDYVVHSAAQVNVGKSIRECSYDAEINIIGLLNLLEFCVKYSVKKFVFSSSAAVYGMPETVPIYEDTEQFPASFYGLSKQTGEKYIELYSKIHGLDYIILRYSNVYGDRQDTDGEAGVVSIFIEKIINKEEIYIDGKGTQTRDFVHVQDVARANVLAITGDAKNTVLNVSTNNETSIAELANCLKDFSGYKGEILYREKRVGDIERSTMDNGKIRKSLGWEPELDLQKGIFTQLKWKGLL